MTTSLSEWVLAALLYFAPIADRPQYPGFYETPEGARARYEYIAADIVAAAEAPELINDGLSDKAEAAALIAQAVGETRLSLDTDIGPCFRGTPQTHARCDRGKSATVFQIWRGVWWGGQKLDEQDLFADRARAAKIMLWAWRSSLGMCKHLPYADRLANLGGGKCRPSVSTRERMKLWWRVLAWNPPAP